jgi:hypothetical protein
MRASSFELSDEHTVTADATSGLTGSGAVGEHSKNLETASVHASQNTTRWRHLAAVSLMGVCLTAGSVAAQWLEIRLADTPRNPDGTPDLTAPAPRTADGKPDLSGIWRRSWGTPERPVNFLDLTSGTDAVLRPAAETIYQTRRENNSKDMPSGRCLPHGLTKALSVPEPFKIVQTTAVVVMLLEEFNQYRQIFTDGRGVPNDRERTWFGYSAGEWEADGTFVVETTGFVDDMWLDVSGHPATESLRITERYRRPDFGHLELEFTIDDAEAYVEPWSGTMSFELLPDTELIEHICENEKDSARLVGQ